MNGMEPIYFSKVEFREMLGEQTNIILLDLMQKEIMYQVLENGRLKPPAIIGIEADEWEGDTYYDEFDAPAVTIKDQYTDFKPLLVRDYSYPAHVIFSYGAKLPEQWMKRILPLCNALDFEPFRNREMSMHDDGFRGYRDEIRMEFHAITDAYIPALELPMNYFYDAEHEWPSEKLYRFLVTEYFENCKKVKPWLMPYYGLSLLFR